MMKRRRNRKNRKGRLRKSPSHEVVRACFNDDSLNRSKPISPLELFTPLKNLDAQRNNTELFDDDLSPIWATPVNKSYSMTGPEGKKFGSIFSSNLFQQNSTPIEKFYQDDNIVDFRERKENINDTSSVLDIRNNLDLPEAPKLGPNLNLNKSLLSEKVLNNESRNKGHSLTYSRLNIIRSSVYGVELVRGGIFEKLLTILKNNARISQRWSLEVMNLCTQLGVRLKNSLSSMCNIYNESSTLRGAERPICKCVEYREGISRLNVKMEVLTEEIRIVKSRLEKSNEDNMEIIQKLNTMKEALFQFKEQFNLKSAPTAPIQTPCLPPPPPPPPPQPPLSTVVSNPLKISKEIKTKTLPTDNSRPVISLDDILKVKLKKTSDRSNALTTTRRLSKPAIAMDVLRQVKLRPASCPSRRGSPDKGPPLASTSPRSSLRRLLINDDAMFRFKRLRKVGGYSFDTVHRGNFAGGRERNGS